jgi:hypothetical protein
LCHLLELTSQADLDCGGLYHSLNGLKLYYSRRYEAWSPSIDARDSNKTS